jgi:hypothetical protein
MRVRSKKQEYKGDDMDETELIVYMYMEFK